MAEATAQSPQVHSGRLKYADPRSLPSFPSSGLKSDGAAAGAAASLGWNNQKTIELWKPDNLSSASAAAVLAKDYKMPSSWEPPAQPDGQKAALLAVGSANTALKKQPSTGGSHEGWGNSAANQAFHANRSSLATDHKSDLSHGSSAATQAFNTNRSSSQRGSQPMGDAVAGDRSLAAAKGAMSSTRQRAISSPSVPSPRESHLQSKAASNALNGATIAHRASMQPKPKTDDVGAVSVTTMTRNMFTSNPPVKPEVDEQQNNERLHQSAVEMAKKMYSQQQKMVDQTKRAHEAEDASTSDHPSPYVNLQDAAYKQAQLRLSKLHDEHQKNRDFQEYYGNTQGPKRRFSVGAKLRRRSSGDDMVEDRVQSEKIRQQMSMFSNKLSEVDEAKRKNDRDALLAAAQRNVKARLHGMDEKVYNETGKVNPTLLSEWEIKAQQAAQSRHESRTTGHKGMVDLGGGKFMNPDEVDAIAAKRMQPILDDINDKAEAERERVAALKLEEEQRKEELEKAKARDRETKEITKQIKEQERQDEKAKKMQAKELEKEAKRQAKEEKRKSKHDSAKSGISGDAAVEAEHNASETGGDNSTSSPQAAALVIPVVETEVTSGASHAEDDGVTSPTTKVKGWIKNRFSRRKSVVESAEEKGEKSEKRRSFFRGGAALRGQQANNGSVSSFEHRASSMRDVAMAGRGEGADPERGDQGAQAQRDSRGVSPVSSDSSEDEGDDGRQSNRGLSVVPPRPIANLAPRSSVSPSRDSRFREEMDAR